MQWSQETDKIIWQGDYYTNKSGGFPYSIMVNKDQTVKVKLKDPFGGGEEYECQITLYVSKVGEPIPSYIIFVKRDGSIEAISTDKYFMW